MIHALEHLIKHPSLGIRLHLPVPVVIFPTMQECRQFRLLLDGQLHHFFFQFGETHAAKIAPRFLRAKPNSVLSLGKVARVPIYSASA